MRVRPLLTRAIVPLIVVGAGLYYWFAESRLSILSYFFLPVAVAAVVFGRIRGPSPRWSARSWSWPRSSRTAQDTSLPRARPHPEAAAGLLLWMVFIHLTAYIVGLVSEVGGNRVLVQGIGADAINAVERERKRMAFDVHDGIAQTVNTALMEAEVLTMMAEDSEPDVREQVERVRRCMGGAVQEIRNMIGNLRPPALAGPEFAATLRHLVEEFSARCGVKAELDLNADLAEHSDSMRICVFRVIQEALSNVEHHAEASRVHVGVSSSRKGVFLVVSDDGLGFDPSATSGNGFDNHHGLASMHERVALLAGRLEIDSAAQSGTIVRAYVPTYDR
ncbi:MAG: sensor histidine kinase [Thermoleophilia bacterium]|nr:sensor histidine kinase [Thermoleophilia bacterium]